MQRLPWTFKQQVRLMEDRGASSDAVSAMMSEMLRNRDKYCRHENGAQDTSCERQGDPGQTDQALVRV